MATKVKMLKLIHEMSEFAHSMPRRPQQNRSGINAINPALVNPLRNPVKRRKIIPILMRNRTDIPTPVFNLFNKPLSIVCHLND